MVILTSCSNMFYCLEQACKSELLICLFWECDTNHWSQHETQITILFKRRGHTISEEEVTQYQRVYFFQQGFFPHLRGDQCFSKSEKWRSPQGQTKNNCFLYALFMLQWSKEVWKIQHVCNFPHHTNVPLKSPTICAFLCTAANNWNVTLSTLSAVEHLWLDLHCTKARHCPLLSVQNEHQPVQEKGLISVWASVIEP